MSRKNYAMIVLMILEIIMAFVQIINGNQISPLVGICLAAIVIIENLPRVGED